MVVALFVVLAVCTIVFYVAHWKMLKCYWYEFGFFAAAFTTGAFAALVLVIGIVMLPKALPVQEELINEKIIMYQNENERIETELDAMVDKYIQYEASVIDSVAEGKSSIALVSVFPELKSNALVQKQLEVYLENNAKIKELKVEKIQLAKHRWILYFGN